MLAKLKQQFRQMLCDHLSVRHKRDFYGGEIEVHGWNRSEWECERCGKTLYRPFIKKVYDGDAEDWCGPF